MLTQSQEKYQEALQTAEAHYRQNPDWVTFFREVLGVDGVVRKSFPTFDELTAFEQSEQYEKIQKLLVKLREKRPAADAESEPTRVITVRLPKSMHEALRHEAHDMRTSMNKLCISKLLQVIDGDLVPSERSAGSTVSSGGTASAGNTSPSGNASGGGGIGGSTAPSSNLASRNHHSVSPLGGTGATSSPYSQQPQTVPPFKPQPRF